MMQSPMEGYRQLGIFGAVGVVFSVGFSLFILPLLVPIAKKTGQPPLWLTRSLSGFFAWQRRRRLCLVLFILAMTVGTAFGIRKLRFEGDIAKLNGITEATRKDDALINEVWGNALGMTVVIARGKTPEEALTENDRVAEKLARDSNVTNLYSLAEVCPAPTTQEANIQRWRVFWTTERRDGLRRTLAQVGGELGFRTNAFDKFWEIVESPPKLMTLDSFRGTPLEQALAERVAFSPGDNAVSTIIKVKDRTKISDLREELAGPLVIDPLDFAAHMAKIARAGLGQFALWTGLLVGGMVFFSLGSIELLIAVLLPLAFGLFWAIGLMGMIGLPIDLMNSVFVIFIIGVGEDYSVFLTTSRLDEWRGQPPMTAANTASVLVSALTTIFGFGVMVIANHPALFSLGATVLLGMVCAFGATVILTPLVMDLLLFRNQPTGAPRFWHPLGTLWVLLHVGGSQVVLYYLLRPILKIVSSRTADDRLRRATRWTARGVVKGMPFGKLEFRNISEKTFSPPCIVISNHQSAVDVMLAVSLPGDVRQTAKKRVFDAPMLGFGCKILGHIMVEPNDPEVTLQRCRDRLKEGACVHFYPEGTRSFDCFVQRFRRGAFALAIELRREILPIIICDSNTAMPRDSYWFERFHTVVKALPRVTPQTFDYSQGVVPLMKHCETIVREALQKQLDEINTPAVARRKVGRLYRYQGTSVEQFVYWKMKLDALFPALDSVVPRQGYILDLGCGYGMATHWLATFTDERTFLGVDYDEDKIRVARRTAPDHPRIRFETADILEYEYPPCDVILLLDVLHYWQPAKQQRILTKARQALRPGGRLVLRDGVRAGTEAHRKVHRWELFATWIGHNRTKEGLHFQTFAEIEVMLRTAGFSSWVVKAEAKQDSNVMLVAQI
jgi:1-acyl-sn-glycerol-3-phosphate acyltransferase